MHSFQVRFLAGVAALVGGIILAYILFLRPWHMSWGATAEEVAMPLPGDPYIPPQAVVSTRAVTIHAPAAAVWPWIVQLGQGRAGFYSYDWLENLFAADMHNADRIAPELQQLNVGDHISLQRNGPFAVVAAIEPERVLVAEGGWTWHLRAIDEHTTRLIVRYASFEVGDLLSKLYYYPIFEPAHFVMESGMMLGIKVRAEQAQSRHEPEATLVLEGREYARR
jgi:hypothetical protein